MDPITIAVLGASAVSGLVQYYNAEKARGASNKRLKEVEDLFNSIKPPDYDLEIVDPPQLHTQELRKPEFSSSMAAPKWNLSNLDLKDLKKVQDFVPQIAPFIEENKPQLIAMNKEMKEGRDAQKTALRRFMEVGQGSYDPEYQQRVLEARRRAQAESQSRGESIAQDFERRGLSGSGLELAAKIGASADLMDRNAMMGLDAETQAYRNQLQALSQGAQLGSQILSQEQNLQSQNADIVNAFNQRMSKRYQDWEQMRADALNAADLRNIQEAQRIADFNINRGNQQLINDRSRLDDITRYNTDFARGERNRLDELGKWDYNSRGAERAFQNQAAITQQQLNQGAIDKANALKEKMYQDALDRARGKAGISSARSSADFQTAQDQNQAIQGFSNLGSAYILSRNPQNQTTGKQQMQSAIVQAEPDKSDIFRRATSGNYGTGGLYA